MTRLWEGAHELVLDQEEVQIGKLMAEMEAILAHMSDGVIICDAHGRIVRTNKVAEEALGCPATELLGQSVLSPQWNHLAGQTEPLTGDTHGPLAGVILHQEECKDCLLEICCRDETHIVRVSASPIGKSDREKRGAVILIRDVTEEQRNQQREEEFLSLLSHELRAPLTVISGYAQMMSRRLARQGLTDEAASAELIKAQVKRMSGMVSDLVESGRLEEGIGALSREKTDLGRLVESVTARIIREQRHSEDNHRITLEVEPGLPQIEADPGRLDQVVTNLLSNAIRYSPNGGAIQIKVERGQPDSQMLRVSVADEGIGIPETERPHIFERAFRGKGAMAVNGQGLGLGLYICKLIVEAQCGQVGVADGPEGVGTTFWFTLPTPARIETGTWTS